MINTKAKMYRTNTKAILWLFRHGFRDPVFYGHPKYGFSHYRLKEGIEQKKLEESTLEPENIDDFIEQYNQRDLYAFFDGECFSRHDTSLYKFQLKTNEHISEGMTWIKTVAEFVRDKSIEVLIINRIDRKGAKRLKKSAGIRGYLIVHNNADEGFKLEEVN